MNVLTAEALENLLITCAQCDNYRGAIIFESSKSRDDFLRNMKDEDFGNEPSINIRMRTLRFKNGSFIEAINASRQTSRARYHAILYDGQVGKESMKYIYAPMVVPYADFGHIEAEDSEKELTEFLNGFKVN